MSILGLDSSNPQPRKRDPMDIKTSEVVLGSLAVRNHLTEVCADSGEDSTGGS